MRQRYRFWYLGMAADERESLNAESALKVVVILAPGY
jgi:hypothetical protein